MEIDARKDQRGGRGFAGHLRTSSFDMLSLTSDGSQATSPFSQGAFIHAVPAGSVWPAGAESAVLQVTRTSSTSLVPQISRSFLQSRDRNGFYGRVSFQCNPASWEHSARESSSEWSAGRPRWPSIVDEEFGFNVVCRKDESTRRREAKLHPAAKPYGPRRHDDYRSKSGPQRDSPRMKIPVADVTPAQLDRVRELAESIASTLGIELLGVSVDKQTRPVTVRIDIRRMEGAELEDNYDGDEEDEDYLAAEVEDDADQEEVEEELEEDVTEEFATEIESFLAGDVEDGDVDEEEDEDEDEEDDEELEMYLAEDGGVDVLDAGIDECERLARALGEALDLEDVITAGSYMLEVSSPGMSDVLAADRDFVTFKGFPVIVFTNPPYFKNEPETRGTLSKRDAEFLHITDKGRAIKIPRDLIDRVELEAKLVEDDLL